MKTLTLIKGLPILVVMVIISSSLPTRAASQNQPSEASLPDLATYYSVKDFSELIAELSSTIYIDLKNVSVREALFQIARKANLEVDFDADFFDSDLTITLQQNSITVGEALEAVLKGTGYESLITMNHQILLREVVPEIVEEPVQQVTVNGRVTDADSGESLMGVTVFVMGTQTGTTTNADGRFTLAVPEGGEVLAFSYVGYVQIGRAHV